MWRGLLIAGGVVLGGALGLLGPVFAFGFLNVGSGSYEDVMAVWLATVPAGVALGAWLGWRLRQRVDVRARRER